MKLLDLQIAAQRAQRHESPHRRPTILIAALVIIFTAAGVALLILQQMVAEMPQGNRGNETPIAQRGSQ